MSFDDRVFQRKKNLSSNINQEVLAMKCWIRCSRPQGSRSVDIHIRCNSPFGFWYVSRWSSLMSKWLVSAYFSYRVEKNRTFIHMFLRRLQKLIYEVFELWSLDLLTRSCRYLNLWHLLSCRITFFSFFWLVTFLVTVILQLSNGELKDIYLTYVWRQITLLILFSFFFDRFVEHLVTSRLSRRIAVEIITYMIWDSHICSFHHCELRLSIHILVYHTSKKSFIRYFLGIRSVNKICF